MKNIFIVFILLTSYCFAQPEFHINRDAIQSGKFFNSEIHYFPTDSGFTVFYLYKISYSQLFFEKNSDHFNAGIDVNLEILDSSGVVVDRNFDRREVSLKDFELTNSEDQFVNGLIQFELKKGKFSFVALISDMISKRSRTLPAKDIILSNGSIVLDPLVVNQSKVTCAGAESFSVLNHSRAIPFNQPTNSVLIPVLDKRIKSIFYNIISAESTIVKEQRIDESVYLGDRINVCDGNTVLTKSEDQDSIKYFVIRNFSSHLKESPIQFIISSDDSTKVKQKFNFDIVWINKPRSLFDPEEAIKFLEIIEPKEKVSELLSLRDYQMALDQYWNKKDPTPETNYNELMNEFYSRIDYCELKFKPINGNSGSKTDRGKTYIKFGHPDSIERDSNIEDKVVETWFYKNLKRSFIFIDYEGTGKFQLVSNQ